MKHLTEEQLKDLSTGQVQNSDPDRIKQLCREILALRKVAYLLIDHILEDEEIEEIEKKDRMLYVGGSKTSYRCDPCDGMGACGCNVFRSPAGKPNVYICNACGARYNAAP